MLQVQERKKLMGDAGAQEAGVAADVTSGECSGAARAVSAPPSTHPEELEDELQSSPGTAYLRSLRYGQAWGTGPGVRDLHHAFSTSQEVFHGPVPASTRRPQLFRPLRSTDPPGFT